MLRGRGEKGSDQLGRWDNEELNIGSTRMGKEGFVTNEETDRPNRENDVV